MEWKGEEKKQNVTVIVSEKRKSEMGIVTKDKIEEMLTEEKMLKLGTEKFSILKKLVGTAENLSTPGVVMVSKYFAGGEKGKVKDSGNDDTEEKGRKTPLRSRPTLHYQEEGDSTGNSGA